MSNAASPSARRPSTGQEAARSLEIREGTLVAEGHVPLHYITAGSQEPTLVLVHCWACNARFWEPQIDSLSSRHRVVALDLGGHGASGRDRTDWSIASFAGDVRTLIEGLDLHDVLLVGHSLGGLAAIEAAAALPGRVRGIVAVEALHELGRAPWHRGAGSWLKDLQDDYPEGARRLVRSWLPDNTHPVLVQAITNTVAAAPEQIAVPAFASMAAYEVAPALARLQVPLYVINSDRWPPDLERIGRYARVDVTLLSGVGHYPELEEPAAFNKALRLAVATLLPE